MMFVYLAGPITGVSYGQATDWRETFGLVCKNVHTVSPMRGKEYMRGQTMTDPLVSGTVDPKRMMGIPQNIFSRDVFDIRRSDAVVANFLDSTRVSIGTVFEIGLARALGKMIIVVMEPGNIHEHTFIKEAANFVVTNLKDAEDILLQIS